MRQFDQEVRQHLEFGSGTALVRNIMLTEFNRPLGKSARIIGILHDDAQRVIGQDDKRMRLKIRPKLPCRGDDGEGHLLQGRISRFGVGHAIARVEDRVLVASIFFDKNATNSCGGHWDVDVHRIPIFIFG